MLFFVALFVLGCLSAFVFTKFKPVLALLASYLFSILVFPSQVKILSFSPSTIFSYMLFGISVCLAVKDNLYSEKNNKKILSIILIYVCSFFFLLPFGSKMTLIDQIPALKMFVLGVFPFIFFLLLMKKSSDFETIFKYIVVVALFVFAYGIFAYSINQNPYLVFVDIVYSGVAALERMLDESRGGLEGRLGGTIGNPVFYAGLLLILFYNFFALYLGLGKKQKVWRFIIVLSLIGLLINLFLTGSRSSLVALLFGFGIFCLKWMSQRRLAIISAVLISVFVISAYLPIFGKYQVYVNSIVYFWDDSKSEGEIKGSSVEMRLNQLDGLANVVGAEGAIFGLGAGWIQKYISENGMHPVLLGFESLLFSGITQYGIIGFILLYILLFVAMFHLCWMFYRRGNLKGLEFRFIVCYLTSYIIYAFMTGPFFWEFFLCSYVIILKYFLDKNREKSLLLKKLYLICQLKNNSVPNADSSI